MLCYHIISIGNKPPKWLNEGWLYYKKRFHDTNIRLTEIPFASTTTNAKLTKAICDKIPKNSITISLEITGELLDNNQFSLKLNEWRNQTNIINFLIGGPNGIPKEILQKTYQWSFSKLTFPHMLVRTMLIEQLYRTQCINTHHPYHK